MLEGALNRLFAYATLVGREIDLDMAQECLADILRATERKVTIDEIHPEGVGPLQHADGGPAVGATGAAGGAAAAGGDVSLEELTPRSLPDIGRRFGGRDHTTVIHAVRKIEELRATDSQIAEDVELLRRMLEA